MTTKSFNLTCNTFLLAFEVNLFLSKVSLFFSHCFFKGNVSWYKAQRNCDKQNNSSLNTLTYKDLHAVSDIKNRLIWTGLRKQKLKSWLGISSKIKGNATMLLQIDIYSSQIIGYQLNTWVNLLKKLLLDIIYL